MLLSLPYNVINQMGIIFTSSTPHYHTLLFPSLLYRIELYTPNTLTDDACILTLVCVHESSPSRFCNSHKFLYPTSGLGWKSVGGYSNVVQQLKVAIEWPWKRGKDFQRMGVCISSPPALLVSYLYTFVPFKIYRLLALKSW